MEVLLWLAPAAAVTVVAMLWAGWAGRRQTRELDRDETVRRLARALEKEPEVAPRPVRRPVRERSTGIAVRRRPDPVAASDRQRRAS